MKTTKTSIGEVAYIDAKVPYKDRGEAVPEGFRLGKAWELCRIHGERKTERFRKNNHIWCLTGASVLDRLDVGSRFVADSRIVGDRNRRLRGIFVVKEER